MYGRGYVRGGDVLKRLENHWPHCYCTVIKLAKLTLLSSHLVVGDSNLYRPFLGNGFHYQGPINKV